MLLLMGAAPHTTWWLVPLACCERQACARYACFAAAVSRRIACAHKPWLHRVMCASRKYCEATCFICIRMVHESC